MDSRQTWVDISLWEIKTCKVLGDLDPIFKVIVLYVVYLLN